MKKLIMPMAALSLLANPMQAQGKDGFRVGVQVAFGQPLIQESMLGIRTATSGSSTTVSALNLNYDRHTPLSVELGWAQGENDFSLDFMSTKKDTDRTERGPNLIYPIGNSVSRLDGQSKLEAQVIDLLWRRNFAKAGNTSFAWGLGLRYGSFKNQNTTRIYQLPGETLQGTLETTGESKAYGLITGLESRTKFSPRWGVSSSLRLAFLDGTVKGTLRQQVVSPSGSAVISNEDVNRLLFQTDFKLRLNVQLVSGLEGHVGYEYRDFNQASTEAFSDNTFILPVFFPNTKGFALSGFTVGLAYRF